MSMTRQAFSALLAPDLRKVYVDTGKEYPREYIEAVNIEDMNWNPETDRQISGLGAMGEKPEGSQFNLDQPILGGTKAYLAIPYGIAVDATGDVWMGDWNGGLLHFSAANETFTVIDTPNSSRARGLMADRDGNMWAASNDP